MKYLYLTDIHGETDNFVKIADLLNSVDYVLIGGDITHFGKKESAEKVISVIRQYNDNIIAVPGNCDYPDVSEYLKTENISVDRCCKIYDDIIFTGIGGSITTPTGTPNESSEQEFGKSIRNNFENIEIDNRPIYLISHQPPYNTVNNKTSGGVHAGSLSVREFIEKYSPVICFTGHIHEGIGVDKVGTAKTVNPGAFREGRFAVVETEKTENMKIDLCRIPL